MEKYFHNVTNLDREPISRQCNDYTYIKAHTTVENFEKTVFKVDCCPLLHNHSPLYVLCSSKGGLHFIIFQLQ
jgi:hypothetical protein